MIRPMRRQHRRMIDALIIFLPLAFIGSLWLRQPRPVMATMPSALESSTAPSATQVWERDGLFTGIPIRTRLWQKAGNPPVSAVEFRLTGDWAAPDALVYWVKASPGSDNSLPPDAILLGPLVFNTQLPLPSKLGEPSGRLLLYSLANGAVVATSEPFPAGTPTP